MHLLERLVLGLFRVRRYVAPAVLVLSFALLAVPLWAGHGCWAPDLRCFALFLVAGLALALVLSPLGAGRPGRGW